MSGHGELNPFMGQLDHAIDPFECLDASTATFFPSIVAPVPFHQYSSFNLTAQGLPESSRDGPPASRQEAVSLSHFQEQGVPFPSPIATNGVKIVKYLSLEEMAASVPRRVSSAVSSLFLQLTPEVDNDRIIDQSCFGASMRKTSQPCKVDAPVKPPACNDEHAPDMRPGHQAAESQSSTKDQIRGCRGEQWDKNFADLQEYKKEFGHCNVPNLWERNVPLSQWVKRQRHQKKLKDLGRHSSFTDHREGLLNGLGFCWCSRDAGWDERFEELRKFYLRHGHCRVARSENLALSSWLKRQRHHSRRFMSGRRFGFGDTITAMRIRKLLDLGVDLNVFDPIA